MLDNYENKMAQTLTATGSQNFTSDLTLAQTLKKHHGSPMRLKRLQIELNTIHDVLSTSGLDE